MFQRLRAGDKHLLSLFAMVLVVNIPFLSPRLIFIHDTLDTFIYFQYAYSEVVLQGEFPRWIPVLNYGISYDFRLLATQPTTLVVMAFGWLLGCKDALLLFKLAFVLSQEVFVLGLYLLSRKLFTSTWTVWIVCVGSVLTTSWLYNCEWNFTSYYLLPLVLFLLLTFLENGRPVHLALAAIVETLSLMGTIAYIAPLHLLILASFLFAYLCCKPGSIWLFLCWRNFVHPLFLSFVVFLALLAALVFGMNEVSTTRGRDPLTGQVTLTEFLERGHLSLAGRAGALVKGDLPHADVTIYCGLLPLIALIYALWRRRDAPFIAFAAVALVLFWFSLGGWFSSAIYYAIPLMKNYRYVSYAMGPLKVFIMVLGGFGFDQLLIDLTPKISGDHTQTAAIGNRRSHWFPISFTLALSCCFIDLIFNLRPNELTDFGIGPARNYRLWLGPYLWIGRMLIYAIAGYVLVKLLAHWQRPGVNTQSKVATLLFIVYFVDVGSYYAVVVEEAPFCADPLVDRAFDVHELDLTLRRMAIHSDGNVITTVGGDLSPHSLRVWHALSCPRGAVPVDTQTFIASWYLAMRIDYLYAREFLMTPGVFKMAVARGVITPPGEPTIALDNRHYLRSLGLDAPRIRLVRHVEFARTDEEMLQSFRDLHDPDETLLIIGTGPSLRYNTPATPDRVELKQLSANRMALDVRADEPGWLFCADSYHPGWKVTVNGESRDVKCANVGCMAVYLDKGPSEVRFYFDDGVRDWVRRGVLAFAFLLGSVLVGSLAVMPFVRRNEIAVPQR